VGDPVNRSVHLRFARFNLIAIGAVALLLSILFTISVAQERQTVQSLSATNLRLNGERLAVELEARTWELAEDFLRDAGLQNLAWSLAGASEPGTVLELRDQLKATVKAHPIVGHVVVLVDGQACFPQLKTPPPRLPIADGANGRSPIEQEFAGLFQEAESEFHQGRHDSAIALYLQSCDLPVSNELKSYALSHLAASYAMAKKPMAADRIYHQLEDRFGGYYDESYQPYALVAALKIDDLSANRLPSNTDHLSALYRDLINGRWQMSAELMEDYKSRIEKRLGAATPSNGETEYLHEFRLARVVENTLPPVDVPADPQRIRTLPIKDGAADAQIYWVLLSATGTRNPVLAFSVNLGWVSGPLLVQCQESLKTGNSSVPPFQVGVSSPLAASDLIVPFRTVFPFLTLRLSKTAAEASKAAVRLDIALVAGSLVMMACLLCLIFILLSRVTRELHVLQLRSDFLSGVSHDLKTPLTLILLYTETLCSDESLSAEDRQKSYQVIAREGRRLNHQITNLLHLSRIQRAAQDYRMSEGSLGPVIDKTAAVCADWLSQHGFSVRMDLARNLPLVRFDPERVSQAVMNVVDNARKYSGASKTVDIRLWSEGSSVILEVQDYGIGIPAGEQQRIFDQFYRAGNAGEQSGSGLGLFLVSDIMRAHGGSIELESEVGQGSRIRLVFPVSGATLEEATHSAGYRVLIEKA